jgi:iron(III) transport system substrate-binding protein
MPCPAPILRLLAPVAAVAVLGTACTGGGASPVRPADQAARGSAPGNTLTVYGRSGESELFKRFEQATGIEVLVRGGAPLDDLAEQIIADGADTPADVFYAPLSDALGRLSDAGRLTTLSDQQLDRVPEAYRSPDGTWVGTSGRALIVVYNTDKLSEDDLPESILGFTDPVWRGRLGWDPANRALQGGIAALRPA